MGRKLPMPACVRPCVCRARHVNGCSCTPPQAASRAGEVGKRRESAQSAICSWNLAGTYDFLRAYIATRNDAGGRAPPRAPQPRMPETDATHTHRSPRHAAACAARSPRRRLRGAVESTTTKTAEQIMWNKWGSVFVKTCAKHAHTEPPQGSGAAARTPRSGGSRLGSLCSCSGYGSRGLPTMIGKPICLTI